MIFPGVHLVAVRKICPMAGTSDDSRSDYGVRIYYGLSGTPMDTYPYRLSEPPTKGSDEE